MKKYRHCTAISLGGLCMLLTLAVRCSCNKNLGRQTEEEKAPDGVWHTGEYVRDVEPGEYKNSTEAAMYLKDKMSHAYKLYRVQHDGSCGPRAFIPIMLSQLLEGHRYKKWMEHINRDVFQPALEQLERDAVSDYIKTYQALAPQDDPKAIYQQTMQIFENLAQGRPRQLQELEIRPLVAFLRYVFLMDSLIRGPRELSRIQEEIKTV